MDAKTFDKSKLLSCHVTEGASRARHRQGTLASRVSATMGPPSCDKALPGAMMSMLRLNIPDVLMQGGGILPGKCKGRDVVVSLARKGAATHAGGKAEVVCYANI